MCLKSIVNLVKSLYVSIVLGTIKMLQFLLSIEAARPPKIHLHNNQLTMIESRNKKKVKESPSIIQHKERGNRCIANDTVLELMSSPDLLYYRKLTTVDGCYHISSLTSDQVWVSDGHNLILTSKKGFPLHYVKDLCSDLSNGLHTVNNEGELIYIDKDRNINKLSTDMKTITKFIKRTNSR